jgi:hypothetical protein
MTPLVNETVYAGPRCAENSSVLKIQRLQTRFMILLGP